MASMLYRWFKAQDIWFEMVRLVYQPPNFNNTNDLQGENCVFLETIKRVYHEESVIHGN